MVQESPYRKLFKDIVRELDIIKGWRAENDNNLVYNGQWPPLKVVQANRYLLSNLVLRNARI